MPALPETPPKPAAPRPRLLLDTGRVAALYQEGRGDAVIVSFAPRQDRASIWGGAFLSRFGVPLIGLVDHQASWFPEADMARILPLLRPILAERKHVVLYGFSMGAYGALKYSAALGAEQVLAFSPQYSIAPADVGDFDRRRPGLFFRPELHAEMRIRAGDLGGRMLVFRDPQFHEDVRHAALIAAQGPVETVATPMSQHDSARHFVSGQGIAQLLRRAIAGRPQPARAVRRDFRTQRRLCPDYVVQMAEILGRRSGPDAAWRLLREAVAAGCPGPTPRLALAHQLLDRGQAQAAAELVAPLAEASAKMRPSHRALLEEVQRRLRLHAGEESPEPEHFPAEDPLWQETARFLAERAVPEDRILAPSTFREALPPFDDYAACDPEAEYDWVILHKGRMPALGPKILSELAKNSTPVFANALFIIWARYPSFGLVDLRDQPEVEAVTRDLTGGWALETPSGAKEV